MPNWEHLRKAAIASELAQLIADPDKYLTKEFGLQPRGQHIRDLADKLYNLATED